MNKTRFEITAYASLAGVHWGAYLERGSLAHIDDPTATKEVTRHYTHCADDHYYLGNPKPIESLEDILTDLLNEGDFSWVRIEYLIISVQYRHTLGNQIRRVKTYSFEPDPARYPDYFVEE